MQYIWAVLLRMFCDLLFSVIIFADCLKYHGRCCFDVIQPMKTHLVLTNRNA